MSYEYITGDNIGKVTFEDLSKHVHEVNKKVKYKWHVEQNKDNPVQVDLYIEINGKLKLRKSNSARQLFKYTNWYQD